MKLLAMLFVFLFSLLALSFSANAEVSPSCGDGFCDNLLGETSVSCPSDCAVEVVVPFCGDGFCDNLLGENSVSCVADCFIPPVAPPVVPEPEPVVPFCGDNFCDNLLGETSVSCPSDCAVEVVVPFCGDGFCDNLLGENSTSCPSDCAIPPVAPPVVPEPEPAPPANNPPVIGAFTVPATADKNTDITLAVTATDNDGGINRIEVLKDNAVIATQSCGSIVSCTKSFIVRVPDAFSAVYTFVARVFDSLGAVATASGSGVTNPAPAAPPVAPAPERPREVVSVSIPSDEIFISSLVPDTGCLAPGDETFLYVSLKNTGKSMLDDVKVTAIVPDSDIRAVSGPFSIRKGDSASRFLYFAIPENAKPGDYYIKVAVTFGKESVVRYRTFEVSKSC